MTTEQIAVGVLVQPAGGLSRDAVRDYTMDHMGEADAAGHR
ncbi:hypothetical protein [Streptomyces sp. NPDC056707]